MARATVTRSKIPRLALAGGLGFWVANFVVSLTPIAAEYRAALSIAYFPMLLEALLGGLIVGFCVSYFLLRFFDKIPTTNPLLKALLVSFIALISVTILIEVPGKFFTPTNNALHYFLLATVFNTFRIFALGVVIGYLYDKLSGSASISRINGGASAKRGN